MKPSSRYVKFASSVCLPDRVRNRTGKGTRMGTRSNRKNHHQ